MPVVHNHVTTKTYKSLSRRLKQRLTPSLGGVIGKLAQQ
nr:MAG TPA: hypothetical protein [Caudoviricetes sp.]